MHIWIPQVLIDHTSVSSFKYFIILFHEIFYSKILGLKPYGIFKSDFILDFSFNWIMVKAHGLYHIDSLTVAEIS